jgi:hypothetical protein
MKLLPILLVILIFISISIVVYSKFLKSKDTDCLVSDWSSYSDCSKPCGGGIRTRTRTVIKNPTGKGLLCPTLTETESCNTQQCATVSYSYNGKIEIDRLLSEEGFGGDVKETIGTINNDILISSYKLSSVSTNTEGFKMGFFEIQVERNGEIIGALIIPGIEFINNIVPLNPPFELKQGDIISLYVNTVNGSLLSITNPTVTFGLDIDCVVSEFIDQTDCLDVEGNIINCDIDKISCLDIQNNIVECKGTKTQVRSITQQPLYGGQECPSLTRIVNCSPCPILSYSYDGTLTVSPTSGEEYEEKYFPIGVINTDFLVSSINFNSIYTENIGQINVTCNDNEFCKNEIIIYIYVRSSEQAYPICRLIIDDNYSGSINKSNDFLWTKVYGENDFYGELKKGDIIMVYVISNSGSSITVKNPTVTFNVPTDCEVSDFVDETDCLDPQYSPVTCGGTKTQVRSILQQSLYGGKECPPLSQVVECDPCPLSFSFSGDITNDIQTPSTGFFRNADQSIGIVNKDYVASSVNFSIILMTTNILYFPSEIEPVAPFAKLFFIRDGQTTYFDKDFSLGFTTGALNKTYLLTSPLRLTTGDIFGIQLTVMNGTEVTIQNPIVTLS